METCNRRIENLYVCTECALFIANGDLPEDDARAKEIVKGVEGEYPYRWSVDSSGDSECFMKRPCDCCKSPLAGDRLYAALLY